MSERDDYPPGVPCWVDVLVPDPSAVLGFYSGLFGWDFSAPGTNDFRVARLRGRDVTGVGVAHGHPAAWNTYVSVTDADATARRAAAAGGTLLIGPFDVLPAGRIAVLADPGGAVFGLWEPHERTGAQLVNEANVWAMSSLHPADTGVAAFYGKVFGWTTEAFGPMTLFRLDGYTGGEPGQPVPRDVVAVMAAPADGIPPNWSVNFAVPDADALAARAAELGGKVIMAPFDSPGFRSTVLSDPAGAVFAASAPSR